MTAVQHGSGVLAGGLPWHLVNDISRIAISTGGGDAPGLNAVIRSVTLAARNRGWQVVGIRDGFNGLMHPEEYPDGGLMDLDRQIGARDPAHRRDDPGLDEPWQSDPVPGAAARWHLRRGRPDR